jgi:hypothetical protein
LFSNLVEGCKFCGQRLLRVADHLKQKINENYYYYCISSELIAAGKRKFTFFFPRLSDVLPLPCEYVYLRLGFVQNSSSNNQQSDKMKNIQTIISILIFLTVQGIFLSSSFDSKEKGKDHSPGARAGQQKSGLYANDPALNARIS